jgi:hypothetical protein
MTESDTRENGLKRNAVRAVPNFKVRTPPSLSELRTMSFVTYVFQDG